MKRWYHWLWLAGIWLIAAIANCIEGRNVVYPIAVMVIFSTLALCQFTCDKYGEKGKKIFKFICIGVILLCIMFILAVVIHCFI